MLQVVSENNAYLQDLNTRSRSIKVHGNELARLHRKIGFTLGKQFLNTLPLKEVSVTNPQGKQGTDFSLDCSNVTIICILRAGLYIAEGVRKSFGLSDHVYMLSSSPQDIKSNLLKGRDLVLVDSVINSGKTLMQYIDVCNEAASISVISLVMQNKFRKVIDEKYPDYNFIISRVSKNSYVGKGQTDTGNRLFGTC
jgi:uracil phosphoribosyltransferase